VPLKKAKEGKMRDKYSIRESEGDKIVRKDEETHEDGKTAGKEENTEKTAVNSDGSRGYGGRPQSALQELMRPAKAHRRVDW